MNDKKFIQLLNLYIDGEATPVEVREVQTQIENDPARRRIYHEYCQIQTATRAIYAQFRRDGVSAQSEAGRTGPVRAAGVRSAAAHPGHVSGRPFRRALFWAGGAAAACLAVALAFWSLPQANGPQRQIEVAEATGVSVPTAVPAVAIAAALPSSYAAPFASETRADPFLIRAASPDSDPFALAPASRQSGFGDTEFELDPVPAIQAARFALVMGPIDPARVAEENRKLKAILRGEIAPQSQAARDQGLFVPVNFRQQP